MISSGTLAGLRTLSTNGKSDVFAVRNAFASGVPPIKTIGSGTAEDAIVRYGAFGAKSLIESSVNFGVVSSPVGSVPPPPQAELDRVEIDIDSRIGTVDGFYATVVFSFLTSELVPGAAASIFRANLGPIVGVSRPASSVLATVPTNASRKNIDPIAMSAFQTERLGIGSKLSTTVGDDPIIGSRVARASGSRLSSPMPYRNASRPSGPGALVTMANIDPSVAADPTFYINRRTVAGLSPPPSRLSTGARSGINVLGGGSITSVGGIVQPGNAAGYRQIGRSSLAQGRVVGAYSEFSFVDPGIVHGNRYAYYVVCDSAEVRGTRSRIVTVDAVVSAPPNSPSVSYAVVGSTPRFTLRSPGSVDHIEVFRRGGDVPDSVQILAIDGALVSSVPPMSLPSGFNHIGDIGLAPDGTVSFVDVGVRPGQAADYRFYSVGPYGTKSQTPATCSLRLSEFGIGIPLSIPSITAEQAVGAPRAHVHVQCDDQRATAAIVQRRILSQGEVGFHSPGTPSRVSLGGARGAKRAGSRRGPTYNGSDAWSGYLPLVSGSGEMDDMTVQYDRVYQYSAVVVAGNGLESSAGLSQAFRVVTSPVIDPPSIVSIGLVSGTDGVTGIKVSWSGSTSDFSPSQLVGSQADLLDSSVRTVYQLERRGPSGRWESLPVTTASCDIDPVSDSPAPPYRPSYAQLLETYQYRVIAMQSGGFLSMRSGLAEITVEPDVFPPEGTWVRSTSAGVRPIAVVVSWDDPQSIVDRWQLERAPVNKVYGSQLGSTDSSAVRGLPYERVAEVTREASRALSISQASASRDPSVYVGSRFFFDSDVSFANTYFYRVRSVLPSGKTSDWSYLGIAMNDSAFDRKFFSTLSDADKASLVTDRRPISSTGVE